MVENKRKRLSAVKKFIVKIRQARRELCLLGLEKNEPTASPYLFEIAEYIKGKEIYLGINTNAYFDEVIQEQFINLKPDLLAISINGNQDAHDKIRRTGS